MPVGAALRQRVEELVLFGEQFGGARQRLLEARIELEELGPEGANPRASAGRVGVVWIVDPVESLGAAVRLGRCARNVEQGAQQLDAGSKRSPAPDARQRARSGAAEESEQQRFRLVRPGMRGRYCGRGSLMGENSQRRVSGGSGGRLQTLRTQVQLIDFLEIKPGPQPFGELANPLGLGRGFRAKPVVYVSDRAPDVQPDSGGREGNGIAAAGAGDQDVGAGGQAGGDGRFDAVRQISHGG